MTAPVPRALRRLTAVATGLVLAATGLATAPAAVADRVDTLLTVGERLERGDALASPDGRVRLQLDHFGGLKLVDRGDRSGGYPDEHVVRDFTALGGVVDHVVLQADGNLVGYTEGGTAVVDFFSQGSGTVAVRVQADRNVVFTDPAGRVVSSTDTWRNLYVRPGDPLLAGDTVPGEGGATRLTMQADGNLVLYRGSVALWSSRTHGNPGAYAVLTWGGDLVVLPRPLTGAEQPLFRTGTDHGLQGGVEVVVEDPEVSVKGLGYGAVSPPVWGSAWASDRLLAGDELDEGDRRTSPDGRCTLGAEEAGLVQRCDGRVVWRSPAGQDRQGVFGVTRMQPDGNLVHYRFADHTSELVDVLFASRTSVPGSTTVVQDDRNVVVLGPDGRPAWSRFTGRLR